MGAGHAHALYVHGHTRIHHLPPEVKVAATVLFVVTVALTPAWALPAFAVHLAALVTVMRLARLKARFIAVRVAVVAPFILFAVFIPFIATGEQTQFLGLSVSAEGLVAARTIVIKAVLGAGTSVTLAATTETSQIMAGLATLRVPVIITTIATFMIRYLEVLIRELGRMRTAMTARAYDPRWLWQVKPIASSAGALFIRSYERGERVHAAMLARGYTGTMPVIVDRRATAAEWLTAASFPLVAIVATLTTLVLMS